MKTTPCDRCGERLNPEDIVETMTNEEVCSACESKANAEEHYCPIGNHTVYGNSNVELLPDNTTPCHECLAETNE